MDVFCPNCGFAVNVHIENYDRFRAIVGYGQCKRCSQRLIVHVIVTSVPS